MKSNNNIEIKPKKKKGKKFMVILWILAVIAFFMLIGSILHMTYFKNEKEKIKIYGEMVSVYDGKMHIYKMGTGKEKIILLPGLNVALPSAEFGPLMRQLSKKYTVVCIDYFGVGFSSQTKRDRNSENYIEEIRMVLKKAGIKAPYVLMPHSISSVYSEYYAAKYPDEIQAIISLDGTPTAYLGDEIPNFVKKIMNIAKFQQAAGFTSIIAPLSTSENKLLSYGYNEKEINDLIIYAGFTINNNTLEQMTSTTEYIKDVNSLTYPDNVPYFKSFLSKPIKQKIVRLKLHQKNININILKG